MTRPFKLIVTDVDGCLGVGEAHPYDLEFLMRLAEMNRAAQRGEPVLPVTLCTGRAAAYVDAMMQIIDGRVPAIFENGAGLYFPAGYRFAWNPSIPLGARKTIARVREALEEDVVDREIGYFQPGKEMAFTLFPTPGYTLDQVGEVAQQALDRRGLEARVEVSVTSVGIWLSNMDKGEGLKWLARETGILPSEMVGVGDASGDLFFLRLVGFSAAPANAVPEVKDAVHYVSPFETSAGFLDIIERVQEMERHKR